MYLIFGFIIVSMIRIMVEMMFDTFMHLLVLNHIRPPAPGRQTSTLKLLITFVIATPILGFVAARSQF